MNNSVLTITTVLLVAFAVMAAKCSNDSGLHTGQELQDCAAIQPNQRQEAATAIKNAPTRTDALNVLVAKYGITIEAAKGCLK